MDLNDEQYHRLQHAIAVTRESLAIAAELGDDLSAFQLKHALHSLHYISELEAEGHDDREPVTGKPRYRGGDGRRHNRLPSQNRAPFPRLF